MEEKPESSKKLAPIPKEVALLPPITASPENTYITDINHSKQFNETSKDKEDKEDVHEIYQNIKSVELVPNWMLEKNIASCIPLNKYFSVQFGRVKNNILNALTFLKNKKEKHKEGSKKDRFTIWKEF